MSKAKNSLKLILKMNWLMHKGKRDATGAGDDNA